MPRRPAGPALRAALMAAGLLVLGLASPSCPAQAAKPGEAAAPAAPTAAAVTAVPAEPGQTTATFGDWVVRCEHPAPAAPNQPAPGEVCEAAQALVIKGQQAPIAQIAFGHGPADGRDAKETGRAAGDAALTLTVLLPVNISFDKPPRLAGADDKDGTTLTLRRCLPGGCLADARPGAELMKALRADAAAKPAHLSFTDAAERTLTLPLSTRGLAQALDDLGREATRDRSKETKDGGRDKG